MAAMGTHSTTQPPFHRLLLPGRGEKESGRLRGDMSKPSFLLSELKEVPGPDLGPVEHPPGV